MIIADNETDVDYLYYEPVARTVVKLIREKSGEPLTIGLHGDWGAGKSSALLMIQKAFASEDRTLCVRFNGWVFEGYDDAKAVLIEQIVAELLAKRSTLTRVKDKAADVLKSVNWFKVARTLGGAALTFATGLPNGDLIQVIGKVAQDVIANPKDVLTGEMFNRVLDGAVEHFKSDRVDDTAPQRMHQFREDFQELLNVADIDRLVVLVDDLDRCLPKTAIATLEAIRLFLFIPKAAFVIAADEGMIEYAVRDHFPDLPQSTGPNSYARSYLEKLVQVPFRMPALGYLETRIYLSLLLYLTSGADGASREFEKLIGLAREALKRPWQGEGFSRQKIADRLGAVPATLDEALQVAFEITPVLTDGSRGNPRQVKRFVNTMTLRLAIAHERGFGEDLKAPVLAKLMLAERFAPDVFNAIALDSAATGKSVTVVELEETGPEKAKSSPTKDSKKTQDATERPETIWARQWAQISPKLSEVDLRPYVFISRDRRAAFASEAVAGPVEALVERLSSTTMAVRSTETVQLAALTQSDAERVFEGLVAKLNASENLADTRPVAAEGLAFLTSHRPALQDSLLGLLRRLPVSKVGPWIVSGWTEAFDESHKAEFDAVISQWAEQTDNPKLAGVAKLSKPSSKKPGRKR